MSPFVAELAEMHRLAASTPIDAYPEEVVGCLRRWIDFDGAVFGFGAPQDSTLKIASASVYGRDPDILDEYALVSSDDPVTAAFLQGPARPIRVDARATYAGAARRSVGRFAQRHDLRHLLLFGDAPHEGGPLRWIVLYRGTNRAFAGQAVERLWAAWQHVSCALDVNRSHTLYRSAARRSGRASALVDGRGSYEAADPQFHALLAMEWAQIDAARLPRPVLDAMARGTSFSGSAIDIAFRRLGTRVVCEARLRGVAAKLSSRERLVADHFASGMSYKEVAQVLGSAPNTVRAQLTHVYRKLGVRDKAALAHCLSADSD